MGALFQNKMLGKLILFCVIVSVGLTALTALILYGLVSGGVLTDARVILFGSGAALAFAALASTAYLIFVRVKILKPLEALLSNTKRYAAQLSQMEDPSKADFSELYFSSRDELAVFSDSLTAMAAGIKKDMASYAALSAQCRRFAEEKESAGRITRNLLPSVYPAFPERTAFDIYAFLGEESEGGYGFYDYFMTDDTHICMTVGEASGTGIPSMLYAHLALLNIRSYARLGYAPHRIASETNNLLCAGNSEGITVSALIAVVDLVNGTLSYVNAGQPDALIKRAGEGFAFLERKQSFVLAGMENVTFTQNTVTLMQGDTLLFMNSAVPEARNDRGVSYGEDSVKDCLNGSLAGTVALPELVRDIEESVDYFCKGEKGGMHALMMFRYFG